MPESEVEHQVSIGREMNVPAIVPLFHADGRKMYVDEADVARWLSEGFYRERPDVDHCLQEVRLYADSCVRLAQELAQTAQAAGVLDREADAALNVFQQAVGGLAMAVAGFLRALQLRYPLREADAVSLARPEAEGGGVVRVDPGQVALYLARGYAPVV